MYNCTTNIRVTRSNRDVNFEFCSLQPKTRRARVKRSNTDASETDHISTVTMLNRTADAIDQQDLTGLETENASNDQHETNQSTPNEKRNATLQDEIEREWMRLKKLREDIECNRAAIESEKLQITRERKQIELDKQRRINEIQTASDQNTDMFGGLMRHFQAVNIEVKVPRFSEELNPIQYLNDLERFLKAKNYRLDQYVLALENILEGSVRIWFEVARSRIFDFSDFKKQFKEEFYSVPIQIRFRNEWTSRRYSAKEGSMTSYLYKQVRSAQFLEPRLPDHQVHLSVVQQFPVYIQNTLAAVDYANIGLVAQALSLLEGTRERPREVNNFGNQNHNNNRYPRVSKIVTTPVNKQVYTDRYQDYHFDSNDGYRDCRCHERHCIRESVNIHGDVSREIVLPDMRIPPPNYRNGTQTNSNTNTGHLNYRSAR